MLRLGEGERPRRGDRGARRESRSRSRPESKRQEADGGVRAHWIMLAIWLLCSRTKGAYLDLQDLITPETLVMHLIVGIVSIATILILNEGEPRMLRSASPISKGSSSCNAESLQSAGSAARSRDITSHKATIANRDQSQQSYHSLNFPFPHRCVMIRVPATELGGPPIRETRKRRIRPLDRKGDAEI